MAKGHRKKTGETPASGSTTGCSFDFFLATNLMLEYLFGGLPWNDTKDLLESSKEMKWKKKLLSVSGEIEFIIHEIF